MLPPHSEYVSLLSSSDPFRSPKGLSLMSTLLLRVFHLVYLINGASLFFCVTKVTNFPVFNIQSKKHLESIPQAEGPNQYPVSSPALVGSTLFFCSCPEEPGA